MFRKLRIIRRTYIMSDESNLQEMGVNVFLTVKYLYYINKMSGRYEWETLLVNKHDNNIEYAYFINIDFSSRVDITVLL